MSRRNRRPSGPSRAEPLSPLRPGRVESDDGFFDALPPFRPDTRVLRPDFSRLVDVEDRRLWHPEKPGVPLRGPRTTRGTPARLSLSQQVRIKKIAQDSAKALSRADLLRLWSQPSRVVFSLPDRVVVCLRRAARRRVLAALGRFGPGARRPKWRRESFIGCVRSGRR